MEVIFKQAEKIDENETERSIVGWASRPTPDRDKELILQNAWRLDRYRKNPVVLLSHNYNGLPIGKALWVKSDSQGLRFKCQFANTERGKEVHQLFKEGILGAFSVGFTPAENGYIDNPQEPQYKGLKRVYKDVELLEISCVSVPANQDALVEFVKSGKIKNKELNDELASFLEGIEVKEDEITIEDNPVEDINSIVKEPEIITEPVEEKAKATCPVEDGTFGSDNGKFKECKECKMADACKEAKPKKEDEKSVGVIELKLEGELASVIEGLQDKINVLNEQIKDIQELTKEKAIEPDMEKMKSPDGSPSIYDITSAVDRALSPVKYNASETVSVANESHRYIVDVYPTQYPSGTVVYSEKESDELNEYYRLSYAMDSEGKVTFNGAPEKVEQSWVVNRYQKDFDEDLVEKIGMVLSGRNRKLVEDAAAALQNLLDASAKEFDEEDYDLDDIEVKDFEEEDKNDIEFEGIELEEKSEEEIDLSDDEIKEAINNALKDSMTKLDVGGIVKDTFKIITGKVV